MRKERPVLRHLAMGLIFLQSHVCLISHVCGEIFLLEADAQIVLNLDISGTTKSPSLLTTM